MKLQPTDRWDRETTLVVQIAAFASLLSFLYYFRHGDLLLYGDAVAHINIARRVFDSLTPGLLQLGTVWLPLPHVLMIPFLFSDSAWQTGIAGSLPSLIAYVLGSAGVFRLVRTVLGGGEKPAPLVRLSAWVAALIFAANPNLIYLQATAMTEPLYLALFIWSVVHFAEFASSARDRADTRLHASLLKCGICLLCACFTRYDGWLLAVLVGLAAAIVIVKYGRLERTNIRTLAKFTLLVSAAPVLWLGYNAAVYRNPLEFANGPYSARAIEQKSATATMPSHPGSHDLTTAFRYFLKAGELTVAGGNWQKLWLVLVVAGTLGCFALDLRLWPLVLLWAPVPFYTLSIAYGGVPIFLPVWWPYSYYNARYGLELLPAFAVFASTTVYFLLHLTQKKAAKAAAGVAIVGLVAVSYWSVWHAQPVSYREAWVNSRTRIALESELAANLRLLPHDATLLMYLGDHVGALQQAGIPLRRVINEGNHRSWKRPFDPDGLWERALAQPQQYVDYVVAFDGDPVASRIAAGTLDSMVVVHTEGQPAATIYWTRRRSR